MNRTKPKRMLFFYRGDFHLFRLLVQQELSKIQEENILKGEAKQPLTDYGNRLAILIQKLEEVEAGAGVHLDKKI